MRIITVIALGIFATLALSAAGSIDAVGAAPATAPATQAAAEKTDVTAVRRGDIRLDIHADGYFEPLDALEVRVDPKAYAGELKIAAIVDNGANVKKGDTLLAIASDDFDRQLAAAENDVVLAHANLDKAKSDVALGDKADALAMNVQKEHQSEADGSVTWWEKVDGPIQITVADFAAREADFELEDSEEQLAELQKMYKSEELTNATTDIVMKRAKQEIALGKISDTVYHEQADEFSKFHYDFLHKHVTDTAAAAAQLTDELQAQQTQSEATRQTSLVSAQAAADTADRKVVDLTADGKLLTIVAPADGVALYGQLVNGNWQNDDEQALRVGETVPAKQVVLTFFTPGKVRGSVDLTEAQFFSVPAGAFAKLTPAAYPDMTIAGPCVPSVPQGRTTPTGMRYPLHIAIPTVEPRLIPGTHASVLIAADLAKNVLMVPLSAVSAGQVWVRDAAGKTEARDVALGASDQTNIEVRSGLAEGETVLTKAKN